LRVRAGISIPIAQLAAANAAPMAQSHVPAKIAILGLIRIGGHLSYGGYDVQTDGRHTEAPRAVARDMDLTETAVREWVKRARAEKKPRPSSRSTSSKACLDRSGEGRVQRGGLLPGATGLHAWRQRPEATRTVRDRQLRVAIRASHEARHRHYGRPRIWKDLHEAGERAARSASVG
jgi:hypothetical protein